MYGSYGTGRRYRRSHAHHARTNKGGIKGRVPGHKHYEHSFVPFGRSPFIGSMLRKAYREPINLSGSTQAFHLRYCELIALNAGASGANTQDDISVNGMFLPRTGGHQPMGFDQGMAMYSRYTVLKSRLRVYATPGAGYTSSNVTNWPYIGIRLSPSTGAVGYADINDFFEDRLLGNNVMAFAGLIYPSARGNGERYLEQWWDVTADLGVSSVSATISGDGSANPTQQQYFKVIAYSPPALDADSVNLRIEVDYYGYFSEPKVQVGS